MSLTSLADAPLLSKPPAGVVMAKSRSLSTPKHKEDQAAIDALFEGEESGLAEPQKNKAPHSERKSLIFSKECLERNSLKSNTEDTNQNKHAGFFPALRSLKQQAGENLKKKVPKEDSLFSKTRDANEVLAGFLADSTSSVSAKRPTNLEAEKEQREEFNSKWNCFSPQPATRLPTLTFSPRFGSGLIQHSSDSLEINTPQTKSAKEFSTLSKKDGDWSTQDVLSLLPDESITTSKEAGSGINSLISPETSGQDEEEESSDFGGYQPSCLSMSVPSHAMHYRNLTDFISLPGNSEAKEKTTAAEKCEKNDSVSILNTSYKIDMLRTVHNKELEMKERQLSMQNVGAGSISSRKERCHGGLLTTSFESRWMVG
ncbi:hypothetical protein L7F22_024032 [Adiantum nelumboides]|nr:hypothetical protein [Adiantum nelumboides]